METILIKALQLILSLSILVIIHECGHFLFARLFKIRVEKFYLFFNPWFSLFKFKPKNSETEYGVGWLPLGGYVKIAGMIDESMDKEQLKQPPKPDEFRSKPAWQRLLVRVGGVLFNFILALIVFSAVLFAWGDSYIPAKTIKEGMTFSETVKKLGGYQEHDIILSIDGEPMNLREGVINMNTLMQFLDAKQVVVERNGQQVTLSMPENFAEEVIATKDFPYDPWRPAVLDSVYASAEEAGLQKGDRILSVNGKQVASWTQIASEVSKEANRGKSIPITYLRDTTVYTAEVQVNEINGRNAIGIASMWKAEFDVRTDEYGFFASIPAGISFGMETLKGYVAQARFIFSSNGFRELGGFGAIGNLFPAQWDWHAFWLMTAFLSIILAVMNILPIPALDGGHVLFLLYELVTRRKPSDKFLERAQIVGMALLFALLIYANGNDLFKAIFK
jgi:regulator of sigma E protease